MHRLLLYGMKIPKATVFFYIRKGVHITFENDIICNIFFHSFFLITSVFPMLYIGAGIVFLSSDTFEKNPYKNSVLPHKKLNSTFQPFKTERRVLKCRI